MKVYLRIGKKKINVTKLLNMSLYDVIFSLTLEVKNKNDFIKGPVFSSGTNKEFIVNECLFKNFRKMQEETEE